MKVKIPNSQTMMKGPQPQEYRTETPSAIRITEKRPTVIGRMWGLTKCKRKDREISSLQKRSLTPSSLEDIKGQAQTSKK